MVLDEGTIGLLRGGVVLTRNLVMSIIKLIALPVAAVLLHDEFGVGLELAWTLGDRRLPAARCLHAQAGRLPDPAPARLDPAAQAGQGGTGA